MTNVLSASEELVNSVERELTDEERFAELEKQKEIIWDAILTTEQGSPEDKKFGEMYHEICRKIFILKLGLENQYDA